MPDNKHNIEISTNEFLVISRMIQEFARLEREDVIGAIMKVGGFRELTDLEIVSLAKKLGQ